MKIASGWVSRLWPSLAKRSLAKTKFVRRTKFGQNQVWPNEVGPKPESWSCRTKFGQIPTFGQTSVSARQSLARPSDQDKFGQTGLCTCCAPEVVGDSSSPTKTTWCRPDLRSRPHRNRPPPTHEQPESPSSGHWSALFWTALPRDRPPPDRPPPDRPPPDQALPRTKNFPRTALRRYHPPPDRGAVRGFTRQPKKVQTCSAPSSTPPSVGRQSDGKLPPLVDRGLERSLSGHLQWASTRAEWENMYHRRLGK